MERKNEKCWKKGTTRLRYIYNWRFDGDKPIVSFYYEKTHARVGYKWVHPVHEVLSCSLNEERVEISDKIILNHYPDNTKSRGSYLPLLELSVKEDPEDDRNMHYLGREYMYIGRCYLNLGRVDEARIWYMKSIDEVPNLRDGLVELAMLEYNQNNYLEVINYLIMALMIKNYDRIYINEVFSWDYTIYNLLSCSYYYL